VVLLEEVRRFHERIPLPVALRQNVGHDVLRHVELEHPGDIIGEFHGDGGAIAVATPPRHRYGLVVLVQRQLFPPELEVGGGEGNAIGPLDATAEGEGDGFAVVRPLGHLDQQTLFVTREVSLPADGRVVELHHDIAGALPPGHGIPGAAVLADGLPRCNDLDVLGDGQALLNGRQVHGIEHGSLLIGRGRRGFLCRYRGLRRFLGRSRRRLGGLGAAASRQEHREHDQCTEHGKQLLLHTISS